MDATRRAFLRTTASAGIVAAATATTLSAPANLADTPVADPLLNLVRRYEAEERRFNAAPHATSEEAMADLAHLTELHDELRYRTPRATTAAGAEAALRLAHDFMAHSTDDFERSLVGAVIAYLHGKAL